MCRAFAARERRPAGEDGGIAAIGIGAGAGSAFGFGFGAAEVGWVFVRRGVFAAVFARGASAATRAVEGGATLRVRRPEAATRAGLVAGADAVCFRELVSSAGRGLRVRIAVAAAGRFAEPLVALGAPWLALGFSCDGFLAGTTAAAAAADCPLVLLGVCAAATGTPEGVAFVPIGGLAGLTRLSAAVTLVRRLMIVAVAAVWRLASFASVAGARPFAGFDTVTGADDVTAFFAAVFATDARAPFWALAWALGTVVRVARRVAAAAADRSAVVAGADGAVLAAAGRLRCREGALAAAGGVSAAFDTVEVAADCLARLTFVDVVAELGVGVAGTATGAGIGAPCAVLPDVDALRVRVRAGRVDGSAGAPERAARAEDGSRVVSLVGMEAVAIGAALVRARRRAGATAAVADCDDACAAALVRVRREGSCSGSSAAGSAQPRTRCGVSPSATPTRI